MIFLLRPVDAAVTPPPGRSNPQAKSGVRF
jgi:hypothetical protein